MLPRTYVNPLISCVSHGCAAHQKSSDDFSSWGLMASLVFYSNQYLKISCLQQTIWRASDIFSVHTPKYHLWPLCLGVYEEPRVIADDCSWLYFHYYHFFSVFIKVHYFRIQLITQIVLVSGLNIQKNTMQPLVPLTPNITICNRTSNSGGW